MRGLAIFLAMAAPAFAQSVPVPSGQDVSFVELIKDAEGSAGETWRFRFLAPEIARDGGSVAPNVALDDMLAVCDQFVAPAMQERDVAPGQVVISFSDRPVVFGETNPDATQFFEAFRIEGKKCVWEGF